MWDVDKDDDAAFERRVDNVVREIGDRGKARQLLGSVPAVPAGGGGGGEGSSRAAAPQPVERPSPSLVPALAPAPATSTPATPSRAQQRHQTSGSRNSFTPSLPPLSPAASSTAAATPLHHEQQLVPAPSAAPAHAVTGSPVLSEAYYVHASERAAAAERAAASERAAAAEREQQRFMLTALLVTCASAVVCVAMLRW